MTASLNTDTLQRFLETRQIAATILKLDCTTLTVAEAAAAVGVPPDQIIKSLLFLADGEPVLVITCGLARIAWKDLADYLGVSRKRLKTATAGQVAAITGYVVGAVPPFGHRQPLRTVVDTAVYTQPLIFGGGGAVDALLRIAPAELRRIVGSESAALAERPATAA